MKQWNMTVAYMTFNSYYIFFHFTLVLCLITNLRLRANVPPMSVGLFAWSPSLICPRTARWPCPKVRPPGDENNTRSSSIKWNTKEKAWNENLLVRLAACIWLNGGCVFFIVFFVWYFFCVCFVLIWFVTPNAIAMHTMAHHSAAALRWYSPQMHSLLFSHFYLFLKILSSTLQCFV